MSQPTVETFSEEEWTCNSHFSQSHLQINFARDCGPFLLQVCPVCDSEDVYLQKERKEGVYETIERDYLCHDCMSTFTDVFAVALKLSKRVTQKGLPNQRNPFYEPED